MPPIADTYTIIKTLHATYHTMQIITITIKNQLNALLL